MDMDCWVEIEGIEHPAPPPDADPAAVLRATFDRGVARVTHAVRQMNLSRRAQGLHVLDLFRLEHADWEGIASPAGGQPATYERFAPLVGPQPAKGVLVISMTDTSRTAVVEFDLDSADCYAERDPTAVIAPPDLDLSGPCAACGARTAQLCTGCSTVRYCGAACQSGDAQAHARDCAGVRSCDVFGILLRPRSSV